MTNGTVPAYATLMMLRDYLSPDGALNTDQDSLLTDCLIRAEGAIDAYTRRRFVGEPGTAYYNRFQSDRVRGNALYLDKDLYALDYVQNGDGAQIPVGSVWLEPRNLSPKKIVRLKSSYVWVWNTDSDVILAGTWGHSLSAPDDIVQATIRTAAVYYRSKDVGVSDVAGFQEGGEVSYQSGLPNDVRWLLAPYRSRTGGAW